MSGFCVATEDGDHIVLGLEQYGLAETAEQVGGRTLILMDDPNFLQTVREGA